MFGIPLTAKFDHGSIERMACRSSCPELSECVPYALSKTTNDWYNSQSRGKIGVWSMNIATIRWSYLILSAQCLKKMNALIDQAIKTAQRQLKEVHSRSSHDFGKRSCLWKAGSTFWDVRVSHLTAFSPHAVVLKLHEVRTVSAIVLTSSH